MRKVFLTEQQKQTGWHERGYVPHCDCSGLTQFVTFRLVDSLPLESIKNMQLQQDSTNQLQSSLPVRAELENRSGKRKLSLFGDAKQELIEQYLDQGSGEKYLEDPEVALVVANTLRQFQNERYRLHAWVIMPNHVHALVTPINDYKLSEIVRVWKGMSGRAANQILGRSGPFWQREYYDRFIRDADHFYKTITYIEENPYKAGLCSAPWCWQFGSAGYRHRGR